ncbi:uncharacterized protein TNCV_3972751 [Trichonephila clavipes]|nr:uncharacterized protein TNCV_3972751 [Trichonephila clavipes]
MVLYFVRGCIQYPVMLFVEQRTNIKFFVRLEKIATKTHKILKHVYGSDLLSRTIVFECHRRFREGRESDEDDGCFRRPQIPRTVENVKEAFCGGT